MTSDGSFHPALAKAIARLLRPLVRLLMRHGMAYGAFEAVAKKIFVEVALTDFALPGRKPTLSRASILTGLTRKDVQRLVAEPPAGEELSTLQYNRATKVLTAWGREPEFHGPGDAPQPLEVDGETGFATLVRRHSGDMPVRAVLDELLRVGAVELLEDGRVALRRHAYVPQQSAVQKIGILGADVAQLIDTIAHNVEHGSTDPRFQRKVMHRGIPHDVLPAFRELSAREGQALLERLDAWLAVRDLSHRPDLQAVSGVRTARVGVGVFHFEQADDSVPQ
jgi:hypothetical protein